MTVVAVVATPQRSAPLMPTRKSAGSAGLQLSDFPDGWRASAPEDEGDEESAEFRECLGVDYSDVTIIGEATSDDFAMGSAEATSDVAIYETETEATTALEELSAGLQSESATDCVTDLMKENVESGVEIGDVELGELSFTPPTGVDEAHAYQLAVSAESQPADEGMSATVYFDIIDLREGDLVSRIQTVDVLSEFDPELRDQLVEAVAGRAAE